MFAQISIYKHKPHSVHIFRIPRVLTKETRTVREMLSNQSLPHVKINRVGDLPCWWSIISEYHVGDLSAVSDMLVSWLESEHVQTINYRLIRQPQRIIAQQHVLFTESSHWANSVSNFAMSICRVSVPFFAFFTPIYNGQKSNQSIAKDSWGKLWQDIDIKFSNFGSEVVKKLPCKKKDFFLDLATHCWWF